MSVNRNQPHVYVLPEDDANRQIANGFILEVTHNVRQIQALPEAGGWLKALGCFDEGHSQLSSMRRYPLRFLVILIDGDGREERFVTAKKRVPTDLADRVFILGSLDEPEDLKQALGQYEEIGQALARDCREGTANAWEHPLLRHNVAEVQRLRNCVRQIFFQTAPP